MPDREPSDLSAFVFDSATMSADIASATGRIVTQLVAPGGAAPVSWVLIEPGTGSEEGLGPSWSARVVLQARKVEEVSAPHAAGARVTHVLPIPYSAPDDEVEDLERWYSEEHTEKLLRCDAWLRVRRYRIEAIRGAEWNRLVVHDLAANDVLARDEVREAMATPWRQRLADRPWFMAEPRQPLEVRSQTPGNAARS